MATPSWITDLITRRTAIGTELAALSSSTAGGKPNNSTEGGGTDHVGYKDGLYRELAQINEALRNAGVDDDGNLVGNEIITEAFT